MKRQLFSREKKPIHTGKNCLSPKINTKLRLPAGLLILILTDIISSVAGAALPGKAVAVNLSENTADRIVLQYEFDGLKSRPVNINGRIFTQIYLAGASPKKNVGAPALPDVSRSVIIPDDAEMTVRILDSSYYEIEDIDIAPSKGFILRTIDPNDVPYTFTEVYEKDDFYPGPSAVLRTPYIMRDHRGIVVTVNPFQYNPVRHLLRVYTQMTVEISTVGKGKHNVLKRVGYQRRPNRAFRDVYSSHFLNYEEDAGLRYAPLDEQGDMLIIAYDAWLSNVQPLVNHKNSIGINTTLVGVSTIGNNATSIKNYIQNVYNTSDLAFVLLVGDRTQVQTPTVQVGTETGESDPSYSKLAGSDD